MTTNNRFTYVREEPLPGYCGGHTCDVMYNAKLYMHSSKEAAELNSLSWFLSTNRAVLLAPEQLPPIMSILFKTYDDILQSLHHEVLSLAKSFCVLKHEDFVMLVPQGLVRYPTALARRKVPLPEVLGPVRGRYLYGNPLGPTARTAHGWILSGSTPSGSTPVGHFFGELPDQRRSTRLLLNSGWERYGNDADARSGRDVGTILSTFHPNIIKNPNLWEPLKERPDVHISLPFLLRNPSMSNKDGLCVVLSTKPHYEFTDLFTLKEQMK